MAEKEERIGITKFKETETPDFELCAYHLITRAEAVERMAKALRSNIVETQAQCSCLNMAEAALNALLGEDK